EWDLQLRVTKEGDRLLRTLLVQCAHCMLRPGAPDSDLRRWGLSKVEEQRQKQEKERPGQKKGKWKKRVLVAVARRLAVWMHRLWVAGEVYDPLYQAKAMARATRKAARKAAA